MVRTEDRAGSADLPSTPRAAVTELFHHHYRRLVGLAGLMVDDRETAEEVVQDAFEALYRNWGRTQKKATTVDGKRATVFGFATANEQTDLLGCETPLVGGDNCWTLLVGVPTRVAVIDTGGAPVVVLTRTPEGNPDRETWLGQFDGFLSSMRFR